MSAPIKESHARKSYALTTIIIVVRDVLRRSYMMGMECVAGENIGRGI